MSKILFLMILLGYGFCAHGQREIDESSSPKSTDRLYGGFGLGLNGGTNSYGYRYFYFGLYPSIGYMINNQVSVGTVFTWQHYNYTDFDLAYNQYGISPYFRFNIKQAFLYSEWMVLNSPATDNSNRKNYNRFLMGVGYGGKVGKGHTMLNGVGMYDILYDPGNRAFSSPWVFRVFLTF
jgi:hypothetical protein